MTGPELPTSIVVKLRDDCSPGNAWEVIRLVSEQGLSMEALGEEGDGELARFIDILGAKAGQLEVLRRRLLSFDEVEAAYVKEAGCEP